MSGYGCLSVIYFKVRFSQKDVNNQFNPRATLGAIFTPIYVCRDISVTRKGLTKIWCSKSHDYHTKVQNLVFLDSEITSQSQTV